MAARTAYETAARPLARGAIPLVRFYSAMLAAARVNWERDNRVAHEIFGCYIIADNWTFAHGVISDVEADRQTITVASSREYEEKVEAETILRILKSHYQQIFARIG